MMQEVAILEEMEQEVGGPAGEPQVLPPRQGPTEERPAGEAGGSGVQTVPELWKKQI